MSTFHTTEPGMKVYHPSTGTHIEFKGDTHRTTDPAEIRVLRGHRSVTEEPSKDELYEDAKALNVEGRSEMSKPELAKAVGKAPSAD